MQAPSKKRNFDRSKTTMKHIRFEDALLEQLIEISGKGQFSSWVKESCRQRLIRKGIKPAG